jgi:RNA polymerase sigma factor (sigma-70 family)
VELSDYDRPETWIDLDDAMSALEVAYPKKAEIVKFRFYAGLSVQETANLLGLSEVMIHKHWRFARAWLMKRLSLAPRETNDENQDL